MLGKLLKGFLAQPTNSFCPAETISSGTQVRFDPFTLGKTDQVLVHIGRYMDTVKKSNVSALEAENTEEIGFLQSLACEVSKHKAVLFVNDNLPGIKGYYFENEDFGKVDYNRALFTSLVMDIAMNEDVKVFYAEKLAGTEKIVLLSEKGEILSLSDNVEELFQDFGRRAALS